MLKALLKVLAVAAGVQIVRAVCEDWRLAEHDLIDHPLMAIWPELGHPLHNRHFPEDGDPVS